MGAVDNDFWTQTSFAEFGDRTKHAYASVTAFNEALEHWAASFSEPPAGSPIWLPRSQCQDHGEDSGGRTIFVIPNWLARKTGLI
jgi:hypothetical protein